MPDFTPIGAAEEAMTVDGQAVCVVMRDGDQYLVIDMDGHLVSAAADRDGARAEARRIFWEAAP